MCVCATSAEERLLRSSKAHSGGEAQQAVRILLLDKEFLASVLSVLFLLRCTSRTTQGKVDAVPQPRSRQPRPATRMQKGHTTNLGIPYLVLEPVYETQGSGAVDLLHGAPQHPSLSFSVFLLLLLSQKVMTYGVYTSAVYKS